jgi:hypothetical protein
MDGLASDPSTIPPDLLGTMPVESAGAVVTTTDAVTGTQVQTQVEKQRADDQPDREYEWVKSWWGLTGSSPAYTAAMERHQIQRALVEPSAAEELDGTKVLSRTIYRNAQQQVSFLLSSDPEVTWKARPQARGLGPNDAPVDADPKLDAFSDTVGVVVNACLDECSWPMTREQWAWDGLLWDAAILKVSFQQEFAADELTDTRNPDSQDNLARIRYLNELIDSGQADQDSPEARELATLAAQAGAGELPVWEGIIVETVDLSRFRVSPDVTGPERFYQGAWYSEDFFWPVSDVLTKFEKIHRDDLRGSEVAVYDIGDDGQAIKRAAAKNNDAGLQDTDTLLVREIYDCRNQRRIVLIEGIRFPVVDVPYEAGPSQRSPYIMWQANPRRNGSWYGNGLAHLLGKVQIRVDTKRSDEERHRRKARPRHAYDAAAMDENDIERINDCEEDEMVPVKTGARELKEAIFTIDGRHPFDSTSYDDSKDQREAEQISGIMQEAVGGNAQRDFSSQVHAAASGQNANGIRVRRVFAEALERVYQVAAELVVQRASPQTIQILAGERAFWPEELQDRELMLRRILPKVGITYDGPGVRSQKAQLIVQLMELANAAGQPIDFTAGAKLLARVSGSGLPLDELIQPDPNALAKQLAEAMQKRPEMVQPGTLAAIAGMGQEAAQRAMAMMPQKGAPPAPGQPAQPPPTPAAPAPTPVQ